LIKDYNSSAEQLELAMYTSSLSHLRNKVSWLKSHRSSDLRLVSVITSLISVVVIVLFAETYVMRPLMY